MAIKNTVENALSSTHHDPTVTSHQVNLLAVMHHLYHLPQTYNGRSSINTQNTLHLPYVGEVNINTQNFHHNEERLRRSKRKRKPVIPLWEQPVYSDSLYGKQRLADENQQSVSDYMDPPITNPFTHTGVLPRTHDRHQIVFPYNVSLKLSESLCNKIFLPEKYGTQLTLANIAKCKLEI